MEHSRMLLGGVIFSFLSVIAVAQQAKPAVPLEPITAILDAFTTHQIVALGEGSHGNEQGHAFRLSLIREPRFAATVNDIVVEGPNARYQDVMDRYLRGEQVPVDVLRRVWDDTTQVQVGGPIWTGEVPELYRAVRQLNASVPSERQLRVLLGDPPIDWSQVHSTNDHRKWIEMRDTYPAGLIQREVLAKDRRALVVFGDMHFQRKNLGSNYEMSDPIAGTIVSLLESTAATRVFTIWTTTHADLQKLQPDVATWPNPSLALVRGTALGAADFTFYYPLPMPRFLIRDGRPDFSAPIQREQWRSWQSECYG